MIPEAWDFAVTSCLRSATQNRGHTTSSTQNLTEYETLQRTFHDTDIRCQRSGLRFTPVGFEGHAGRWWEDSARNLVTWISERSSTTAHRTVGDTKLEMAQRIPSSLPRSM